LKHLLLLPDLTLFESPSPSLLKDGEFLGGPGLYLTNSFSFDCRVRYTDHSYVFESKLWRTTLLLSILINLIIVYIDLKSPGYIARLLGAAGLIAVHKFFGVILLAIAVKIFATNAHGLIK